MSEIEDKYKHGRQKDLTRRAIRQKPAKKKRVRPRGRSSSFDEEAWGDALEPIMPHNEKESHRMVESMLEASSAQGTEDNLLIEPGELEAQVVEVIRGGCRVATPDRQLVCSISGALHTSETGFTNLIAVGDHVVVLPIDEQRGVVTTVLPRRSILMRREVLHGYQKQAIVANADQILIVTAWREPNFWPELVDRYLVTAFLNHLHPILCVTKIDLVNAPAELEAALAPYRSLELDLVLTSVKTAAGTDRLAALLRDKLSVLVGLSGVGKSTLLNALQPELGLKTGSVSEGRLYRGQGRHTTTGAMLFQLVSGGAVVDTPGIREFGLVGLRRHELAGFYPEIAHIAKECRFKDCLHTTEPGCAVRQAQETGELHAGRYTTYTKILSSLQI